MNGRVAGGLRNPSLDALAAAVDCEPERATCSVSRSQKNCGTYMHRVDTHMVGRVLPTASFTRALSLCIGLLLRQQNL